MTTLGRASKNGYLWIVRHAPDFEARSGASFGCRSTTDSREKTCVRIFIIGASGMAGHKLLEQLSVNHQVAGSVRSFSHPRLLSYLLYPGVDVLEPGSLLAPVSEFRPDVVVNAVGLVKQREFRIADLVATNAWFPHQLASLCHLKGIRLLHLSTDCVYSGRRGMYSESDRPDADEPYGMSKVLGEPEETGLTIRTSLLGRELRGKLSLIEWLYAQSGRRVKGFRKAFFSGVTTLELARIIDLLVSDFPDLTGTWHVASERIDKDSLLRKVAQEARLDIEIQPDDSFQCDRSLDGSRFEALTGYSPPDWDSAIRELVEDGRSYEP